MRTHGAQYLEASHGPTLTQYLAIHRAVTLGTLSQPIPLSRSIQWSWPTVLPAQGEGNLEAPGLLGAPEGGLGRLVPSD